MASKFVRNNLKFFKGLSRFFMSIQKHLTHIVNINHKDIEPCIYAMWHTNQFCVFGVPNKAKTSILVSKSVDGEIVTYGVESLGFKTVRGSSGKKGAIESTMQMIDLLKNGENIALMVDGPSGPLHKVKNGVIKLAQMSGAPIIPMCWYSDNWNFLTLPSWDKMTTPIFSTKLVNLYGEPIYVPSELTPEQFEEYKEKLKTALFDIQDRVEGEFKKAKKERRWAKGIYKKIAYK